MLTRDDIERWAERVDSKFTLPTLVSRLVRSTTLPNTQVDFPSGSAAYVGGWDGVVNCPEDTAYVPKGISLWEFGTEADNKGKADDDYDKRSKNPEGYNPKDCTFIFVTPRFWSQKDKWITAKNAEGIWKDVRVYDSSRLLQWLERAHAVTRWFATHTSTYPYDGIQTADEFWEEWSVWPGGTLYPEVITAGRINELQQILTFLQDTPGIKGVKASTKTEAVAFIIAAAKQFVTNESERFFAKSLIVDTAGNYRGLRINISTPLNLIPVFDDLQPVYAAVSKGHHVLVPLGGDDSFNGEAVILPTIDWNGQVRSLEASGLSNENAKKYSRESGRNITVLKKLIGFPHIRSKWLDDANVREIIPALLIGRWNEKFKGDIELLEKLSGLIYEKYLPILTKWRDVEESPLIQIGETWRLTSPLDAWTNLSSHLTKYDFEKLHECFTYAFQSGNPIIEPEVKSGFADYFNKEKKFSQWSREGLTQSLILVGRFGDGLKIPSLHAPQLWVDGIIQKLLENAKGDLWISINHELPLISEASPISFIKSVQQSLARKEPEVMDMFIEVDGFLSPSSNHTGLLWALEGLAWMPEYLRDASLILLQLGRLDPGGNLSNRPMNSLREVFKPWHYQTLATRQEQNDILEYLVSKEPDKGWELLIGMLSEFSAVGQFTHKMRWRMFDKSTNLSYTWEEIYKTYSFVISLLIRVFDNNEKKFSEILDESVQPQLHPNDRTLILDWADKVYNNVTQSHFLPWQTLRKILNHHRSHPNAEWALDEKTLILYEDLYLKLKPTSLLDQNIWLFNEHWPEFPEGFIYDMDADEKRHEQQQKKIDEARVTALKQILEHNDIESVLQLRKSVKEPWTLGDSLARVVTDKDKVLLVCQSINDEKEHLSFFHSFIFRKSFLEGLNWIIDLFEKLITQGYGNKELANVFIPLNQTKELWDYIETTNPEIQQEYWKNVRPHFYHVPKEQKLYGLRKLIDHKRYYSAIHETSHFTEEISTEFLMEMMFKIATEETEDPMNLRGYEVDKLFETIDKREDANPAELVKLEWSFLPLLASRHNRRSPKVLHEALTENPDFFIEVLKWLYKPKNEERTEEEANELSPENKQNRARQAYELLKSWKKIPGMTEDNSIDYNVLESWINKARELATNADRLDVADAQIAQVLAEYPEKVKEWPQKAEAIFKIIDTINSDSLSQNYSSAMFNKRSFSSRGPFEGGTIERGHATYFEKLANDYKNKYPVVSVIFNRLAQGYIADAKKMDEEAERDRLEY